MIKSKSIYLKKVLEMEEPVISRLDRLDNELKQLEMMRGGYQSSTASTTSSSAELTDDQLSPRSVEKQCLCRPMELVRMETGLKGTVIQRLAHVEDRMRKLEEEMEMENRREAVPSKTSSPRKSLKQLVKSCVKPKPK